MNTYSSPSGLKITDLRITDINDAPKHCTLIKLYTNQDIVGYGEVRDASSKTYALMLKSRLLGQNPCNVDKIFRRIKQFGHHSRQGGGVSGVEAALWDLAGKAYGVPVYQMLGGKFRDSIRIYCDTDVEGRHTGADMGRALKKRMDAGFSFLKMDLGLGLILDTPGTVTAPLGFPEQMKRFSPQTIGAARGSKSKKELADRALEIATIAHPFTGMQITEKGLDLLEEYVAEVREVIGYEVPLAVDHFGHMGVESGIRFARRMEKYNLAWLEDMIPWQYTDQYRRLKNSTTVPICTGEDIYLKENFRPLLEAGAVTVLHPDVLTAGGILETKKIGDMAADFGVALALHMAESPIGFLAAIHAAAAVPELLAVELHSSDVPWWDDLIEGPEKPLVNKGFTKVPESPGLGIESLNEKLIAEHIHPDLPGQWEPTDQWDSEWSNDRLWS
jgi:L-alanine-DL-glutamate epimerase-like enolase superfamily enzyme